MYIIDILCITLQKALYRSARTIVGSFNLSTDSVRALHIE